MTTGETTALTRRTFVGKATYNLINDIKRSEEKKIYSIYLIENVSIISKEN